MRLPKPKASRYVCVLGVLTFLCWSQSCSPKNAANPSIEFVQVPRADAGGPDVLEDISGRVIGARPGQQLVLYAKAGIWWVQPMADQPFTPIQAGSKWHSSTHLGTEYAALLVEPGFKPEPKLELLPKEGGLVVTVKTVAGTKSAVSIPTTLKFSGYDWEIRTVVSERGGTRHSYDPANAWTDEKGLLHLRIAERSGRWTCAELKLPRSLGYGMYSFVIRDSSALDPAVVASMFTWDDGGDDPNHREISLELTRWGDPANQNAQFVVQPYYVPVNVSRFTTPAGVVTHSFRWEPGRVTFKSVRGTVNVNSAPAIAEHIFNSGVPSPGNESIHLNLYIFGNNTLRNESEVVIEKFEYLP